MSAGDEPQRVLCCYCGKRVLVLSDATVRRHRDAKGRLCEGWGQFAEQVDAERILVCSHPRGLVCVWCAGCEGRKVRFMSERDDLALVIGLACLTEGRGECYAAGGNP